MGRVVQIREPVGGFLNATARPITREAGQRAMTISLAGHCEARVGRLDFLKRLPGLETVAREHGADAEVWQALMPDGLLGVAEAASQEHAARIAISPFLRCPVKRLAVVAHEAEHLARRHGHLVARDPGALATCEAAADAAGELAARAWAGLAARRCPAGTGPDPSACVRCYQERAAACPQGDTVLAAARRALPAF